MLDRLEEQWPGLRDRLLATPNDIRPHIHVYVDKERAQLDSPVGPASRVDVIAAISGG
jgi:molybdopterin converting factor small subunit